MIDTSVLAVRTFGPVTLLLGDCREILPALDTGRAAVVTDPVWPNVPDGMFEHCDAPQAAQRQAALPLGACACACG